MKIAFFDCFSGAAGDMIIGALLDAGLPFDELKSEIEKLGLKGYRLGWEHVTRNNIAGTKFTVEVSEKQPHRTPGQIISIIQKSGLGEDIKADSAEIFNRLAVAEAKAHGEPVEKVHFHEVGAVDAIIDICGTVIGLRLLGIEKVYSSPLALGTGKIETEHGVMPVPAPATADLARGFPVRTTDIEFELTTPTGAVILTTLARFEKPDEFRIDTVGYGAGSRDLPGLPNLLRVMIGQTRIDSESDVITVMETNLDRATPESLGEMVDELLEAGALDVFITPVLMKKNRPGHLLTLLCSPERKDKLSKIVFTRGLTLGIRVSATSRIKLKRRTVEIQTSGGRVSVKIGSCDGSDVILPEFDHMAAAMKRSGRGYDEIFFEIKEALRKEK